MSANYGSGRLSKGVSRLEVRSGLSFSRGVTIDQYLDEASIKTLYAKWLDEWGEKIDCGGGIYIVTCEMVKEVPLEELVSTYGRKLAARLQEVAETYSVL